MVTYIEQYFHCRLFLEKYADFQPNSIMAFGLLCAGVTSFLKRQVSHLSALFLVYRLTVKLLAMPMVSSTQKFCWG